MIDGIAMHRIAPSEKDTNNGILEKKLRDAGDQFRANSGLDVEGLSIPLHNEIGVLTRQIQSFRRTRNLLLTRLLSGRMELKS